MLIHYECNSFCMVVVMSAWPNTLVLPLLYLTYPAVSIWSHLGPECWSCSPSSPWAPALSFLFPTWFLRYMLQSILDASARSIARSDQRLSGGFGPWSSKSTILLAVLSELGPLSGLEYCFYLLAFLQLTRRNNLARYRLYCFTALR